METGFLFDKYKPVVIDTEELFNKNRVICHSDDYKILAESGMTASLVEAGVEVCSSDLCESGKIILTGALAIAAIKEGQGNI